MKMFEKSNWYKVLKIFLDSPIEEFGLRELSRRTGIAPMSVQRYLKEFELSEMICTFIKKGRPLYRANREHENFVLYKKFSIVHDLHTSGVIDYLWEQLSPQAIILYGSQAKGESIENSDIDIFVIGKEKEINLEKYEHGLGKKIHLLFNNKVKAIPNELKNNLINGVVLKGYFKVV